jgi:hypothetical protein
MNEETRQQLIKDTETDLKFHTEKLKYHELEIEKAQLLLNILNK